MKSRYRRPSWRGALIAAAVVLVVSIAIAVGLGAGRGDDSANGVATTTTRDDEPLERVGSDEVDGDVPLLDGETLDSYRITYRVAQRGSSRVSTEVLTVDRPFTSELETRDGDDAPLGVQRWAFGRVINRAGDEQPAVFAVMPHIARFDFRPSISVDEAIQRGLLDRREQREVAGRSCQVYRAATSVDGGALAPLDEASEEYADACFDTHGLLLEEWWIVDGHAIRQRVATAVEEEAPGPLGAGWSEEATSQPVGLGGGSVIRLREGSAPPGPFFEAPSLPAGFTPIGRYSVVPPQAIEVEGADRGDTVAATADVWRRGVDILILDQGGTLGGRDVYSSDPDNRVVAIPGLGTAEVVLGLATNEVRIPRDGGRYVRVAGTLSSEALISFAQSLVETQGTEIVADDGPLLPA